MMPWSRLTRFLGGQRDRQRITRDESSSSDCTVIVPLYIYPEPGAWRPLHESITTHRDTRFVVVVNPANGPGAEPIPDRNYLEEVPKLTAHSNVDVVGYVHTTFTRRNISAVLEDIATFSKWSERTQYPGLALKGVFVDETPNEFDARAEKFLRDVTDFAKNCSGFGGKNLVIHNPGCVPSWSYMALADITVIFEDTGQVFQSRNNDNIFEHHKLFASEPQSLDSNVARQRLALMIHSIDKNISAERRQVLVKEAKKIAGNLFVTDLDARFYSEWSSRWTEWIDAIARN